MAKGFLKPLREREAAQGRAAPLALPTAEVGERTFHEWLSTNPDEPRGPRDSATVVHNIQNE